jgi:hypothetical protein
LVNHSLGQKHCWWLQFLPTPDVGEITQQIVKPGRQIIINRQSLLDELLATPLKIIEARSYSMDIDTQRRYSDWR